MNPGPGAEGPVRARWRTGTTRAATLLVLICLGGCIEGARKEPPRWWEEPAEPLPVRPEDYVRYPREGFGFVWERATVGFKVDTFAGLVTKDLVADPDTTIALRLTEAELDTIYRKAIEIRFFEYPQVLATDPTIQSSWDEPMRLEIHAGDVAKVLMWEMGEPAPHMIEEWKRLFELLRLIEGVTCSRPEFQALPPARGAP